LLDLRNNSWWPLTLPATPEKFFAIDNDVRVLCEGKLYCFDTNDENYYDYDYSNKTNIEWFVKSQKLHLNAINYTKHVTSLTLYSVLNSDVSFNFKMIINNYRYRKKMVQDDVQTMEYYIDVVKTYVKRVNYPKINEFQYELRHNDEQVNRTPLSLTGVTIKYNVTGEVR
jgi:hypothetical protein